jgi:hypothetical protein
MNASKSSFGNLTSIGIFAVVLVTTLGMNAQQEEKEWNIKCSIA